MRLTGTNQPNCVRAVLALLGSREGKPFAAMAVFATVCGVWVASRVRGGTDAAAQASELQEH
ncbi:MAG: hypothetical protein J4F49_11910 [Rhodobacteraceae bacterium]|nr:hypothetical protein [Paracoccaceae bacterium]